MSQSRIDPAKLFLSLALGLTCLYIGMAFVIGFNSDKLKNGKIVQQKEDKKQKENKQKKEDKLPIPEGNDIYHPYDSPWTRYADVDIESVDQRSLVTVVTYTADKGRVCVLVLPKIDKIGKVSVQQIGKFYDIIDREMKKTPFDTLVSKAPPEHAYPTKQIIACYKMG